MTLVKLKTSKTFKANQTNILPILGEVKFDENASISVDSEKFNVDSVLELLPEFSIVKSEEEEGEDIKKKSEDNDLGKSGGDSISPQIEESDVLGEAETASPSAEDGSIDLKAIEESLKEKDKKELAEMIKNYPSELTEGIKNKPQMIAFILEQAKNIQKS